MKNNKIILAVAALLAITLTYWLTAQPKNNLQITIAVFKTANHPALDEAQVFFQKKMVELLGENISFKVQNAQGLLSQANMIAAAMAQNSNFDLIYTIGTLATQAMAKNSSDLPIVFAAVTDPEKLQLGENICGATDGVDYNYLTKILTSSKLKNNRLGIIYSLDEPNSTSMVGAIEESASKDKFLVHKLGIQNISEISLAVNLLCKKSDLLVIPLDNRLVSSASLVTRSANKINCPVLTLNESPIHMGATLSLGVDYKNAGVNAAIMASKIINGVSTPLKLGYKKPREINIFGNKKLVNKFNLSIGNSVFNSKIKWINIAGVN
jgi:putative ABC transport system substrate-binding protein